MPALAPVSFEIKSATLPLVALLLKSAETKALVDDLAQQFNDSPGFFDQDPLVIDLSQLGDTVPDFFGIVKLLRSYQLCPMAVKGGSEKQYVAARRAGLTVTPDVLTTLPTASSVAATPVVAAVLEALVVDKPLRSGQQVYARGRDLVVLAPVNPGAEVMADGHIHVYAPLRGKAIAGARGNQAARIFALSLEAELISIAGIYRTSDVGLPPEAAGKTAQVRLQDEKLVMQALSH